MAIIPANLVAILVTPAGLMFLRWLILGRIRLDGQTWGLFVPELFLATVGRRPGGATLAYHLRRRGRCRHCGRA